jgi:hypothetical protein
VEKRLDEMDKHLDGMDKRYALQVEVQSLRARLDAVEGEIAALQKPRS